MAEGSALEGYPVVSPALCGPATFDQFWADLTFVHWPVYPADVARFFPPGTRPDVFDDGMTYVGLVPFALWHTRFSVGPVIPYVGSFLETNVRLYSVDGQGRHGVVFVSLETTRLAVVPFTRFAFGVPYMWARMRMARTGDRISYQSRRRWPRPGVGSAMTVAVGEPVSPTALETWCTARWGAHTRWAGRTWWVPNEHGPWPLRAADLIELSDDLVAAAGVRPAGPPLRALFSPGVRTRFGRRVPVDQGPV